MPMNYRVPTRRGPNNIVASPERLESADGLRWATGRWVKGEGAEPRTYVPVQVWALKMRDESGKAVAVETGRGREQAEAWVAGVNP